MKNMKQHTYELGFNRGMLGLVLNLARGPAFCSKKNRGLIGHRCFDGRSKAQGLFLEMEFYEIIILYRLLMYGSIFPCGA